MTGRHYEYLTNSYVQAMGMEPFLHERTLPTAVWVPEFAAKPVTMRAFFWAVVYNHTLYFREADGLAWSRWA
jgi:ribonucleotide reductase beta subunit family protein with ferritin-like domain